ncbi:ABC transporter permease subunit [Mesotoga sp. UBA5557]|jgi:simple sugar transport system permease protein|uniref:ABC transporter permease subunit n=1 Tax=Mesotoga sp. UBA5557 TaxID=1946857 RepID=UPI0025EA4907|nr:ABC transporter permease [Mesotoga sp. UBA5557]
MLESIRKLIDKAGWPRVIIALFLLSMFVIAPFVNISVGTSISDTIVRFAMNSVLVLSLVPMVQSGCGLNFGMQLGVIAGLIGAVTSIELGVTGLAGFLTAIGIAIPIAAILGFFYGLLLNRVKGDEMVVATYVGFSSVAFMSMMWLLLPYKSPNMIWGYGGSGLRTTISVEGYWLGVLNNFLSIKIGNFFFPTGTVLFFGLMALIVWAFFKTKLGTAMTAAGSNPIYAKAAGVNVDRMRILSVVISTIIAAVGILVYEQSFGFIQLYMAPLLMAFPAVAALLLGGASVSKASMGNVIIGAFLFQGILTMTPSVMNNLIKSDMSEVIRIIVSNGMIVYALTRRTKVTK